VPFLSVSALHEGDDYEVRGSLSTTLFDMSKEKRKDGDRVMVKE
jgi:hypothetical protein